jgi:16S rRNA (cytosine1402-N4)-methyltransferase
MDEVARGFEHRPVLLQEVLSLLDIQPGFACVDATVGGGGHARPMAEKAGVNGLIIGIDQDQTALNAAEANLSDAACKIILLHGNFRRTDALLHQVGIDCVDTVLMDIGVSSHQLDVAERGFTFHKDVSLDMRMDKTQSKTAADLVNSLSVEEIARILREYAQERWAGRIAKFIVEYRQKNAITTTGQLVEIIKAAIPAAARRDGPHPARRTFQALRIAVNEELDALSEGLDAALNVLRPGGRLAVITFHSLEDRIVKERFKEWARACECPLEWPVCQCGGANNKIELITRRPVVPSTEEIESNPRSRSSKLRVCQKKNT